TQDLTSLASGTYSVTVTDASGCTAISSIAITQPDELVITTTPSQVTCFNGSDGSISLNVTGGTGAYAYLWNDGETTANRIGLAAGTYAVKVTDASGCAMSLKIEVSGGTCAPVAEDDDFVIQQDMILQADVAPNDSDPQNEKLTFT